MDWLTANRGNRARPALAAGSDAYLDFRSEVLPGLLVPGRHDGQGPSIDPFGGRRRQIDAAMAGQIENTLSKNLAKCHNDNQLRRFAPQNLEFIAIRNVAALKHR